MLAFTFPGQGSQRSGMGHAWVDHPSWEVAGEASEIAGRDLTGLLLDAPMEELTRTANAQLATFVMSLVVLDAVERLGPHPGGLRRPQPRRVHRPGGHRRPLAGRRHLPGHRTGRRHAGGGRRPARAPWPPSSGSPTTTPRRPASGPSPTSGWPTTTRPGQVVIAGTEEGIAAATAHAKELGARKVLPIPVSGAFHTPMMLPARTRLRERLEAVTFHAPEVPVVANVDARVHTDAADWPGLLSAQLCSPVRWRHSLEVLSGRGSTLAIELGPGGVLSGMVRRATPDMRGRVGGRARRPRQADGPRLGQRRVERVGTGQPG